MTMEKKREKRERVRGEEAGNGISKRKIREGKKRDGLIIVVANNKQNRPD